MPAVRHAAGSHAARTSCRRSSRCTRTLLDRTPGLEVTPALADEVPAIDLGFHLDIVRFMANPLLERAYGRPTTTSG